VDELIAHTGAFPLPLDRVRGDQRGSATAIFQWAWGTGGLASGFALGVIASTISTGAVFWSAVAIATGGFVLLLYGQSVGWTRTLAAPDEELATASG
jgi:hypothetical protein